MAIFLIIVSHVVQTIGSDNIYVLYKEYMLDLSTATTNLQYLTLSILRYCGVLGNNIFFICSAWFLMESKNWDKGKWFFMLVEVWIISVIILAITYFLSHGQIATTIIIRSFLPTTFSNNWYISCYLLFYPLHPILNSIIRQMNKQSLFRISAAMLVLYVGFNFVIKNVFFSSMIILWITIYFAIAYIKSYLRDFADDFSYNIIFLLIGFIGFISVFILTNSLGLHSFFFRDKLLYWLDNCNPFLLIVAFSVFNLARNVHIRNHVINYISKMSLLVYIIHENIILRTYYRPYAINQIYYNYGYDKILVWVFIIAIVIFALSILCAVIYEKTLQKWVYKLSESLFIMIKKIYLLIENYVLNFE